MSTRTWLLGERTVGLDRIILCVFLVKCAVGLAAEALRYHPSCDSIFISESGNNGRWALQADAEPKFRITQYLCVLARQLPAGRIRACGIYPRLAVQYQIFACSGFCYAETSLGFGRLFSAS